MGDSDNLEIWNAVSKTDPAMTKRQKLDGRDVTTIDPYYRLHSATAQFGPVGRKWGYDVEHGVIQVNENLVLATADVEVWFIDREFRFGPERGLCKMVYMTKGDYLKIDDDASKKATTDGLGKCLSRLGFQADVYMGKFDDNRYVKSRGEEVAAEQAAKRQENQISLLMRQLDRGIGCENEEQRDTIVAWATKGEHQTFTACCEVENAPGDVLVALKELSKEISYAKMLETAVKQG